MAEGEAQGGAHPWEKSYPENIDWNAPLPKAPLQRLLDDAVARFADRPAIDFMDRITTYRELGDLANRAAEGFQKLGVRKGTKVGILLPNCTNFVAVYYGVLKAGGTVVNVNPLYAIEEDQEPDRGFGDRHPGHPRPLHPLRQGPHRPRPDAAHPSGDLPHGGHAARPQTAALPPGEAQRDRQDTARFPSCVLPQADRQRRQAHAGRDRGRRRYRGASVHRRHHRNLEGRDADPRQPLGERGAGGDDDARCRGRQRGHDRRAAALPRLRHGRGDEFSASSSAPR